MKRFTYKRKRVKGKMRCVKVYRSGLQRFVVKSRCGLKKKR